MDGRLFDSVCTYTRRIFNAPSTVMQFVFHQVHHYLFLLTEVHGEDLGVAHGPFDPVEGSSGGDRFLCSGVLRGQKQRKIVKHLNLNGKKIGNRWSEMDESTEVTTTTQMLLLILQTHSPCVFLSPFTEGSLSFFFPRLTILPFSVAV